MAYLSSCSKPYSKGRKWGIRCQLPENFTQESLGIGKLGSAPTPTDIDSTGWGCGDLDQVEEETFKRGLPACSRQRDSGFEHPDRRCSGRRRRHRGWSTENLRGRCQCGWDIGTMGKNLILFKYYLNYDGNTLTDVFNRTVA